MFQEGVVLRAAVVVWYLGVMFGNIVVWCDPGGAIQGDVEDGVGIALKLGYVCVV